MCGGDRFRLAPGLSPRGGGEEAFALGRSASPAVFRSTETAALDPTKRGAAISNSANRADAADNDSASAIAPAPKPITAKPKTLIPNPGSAATRAPAIDSEALQRLAESEERRAEAGEPCRLRRLSAQDQPRPRHRPAFAGRAGADDQTERRQRGRGAGAAPASVIGALTSPRPRAPSPPRRSPARPRPARPARSAQTARLARTARRARSARLARTARRARSARPARPRPRR